MKTMKVFGGLMPGRGKVQVRTVVAAPSKAEAARILGISVSYMRDFWGVTGSSVEIEAAMSQPGVVFQASSSMGRDFVAVIP